MKEFDLVIVGGSAAGAQAAIVAQRQYQLKSILVIRQEDKVMVPCGIPYIYGTLGAVDSNIMPDTILGDANLLVDKVISVDPDKQVVTTAGGEKIGYKKLILATGSIPIVPPIRGIDLDNVFCIRQEAEYLHYMGEAMDKAGHVVIIGGGFIGVEFADECRKRGLDVSNGEH